MPGTLLEREAELARLEAVLQRAQAGAGAAVVVEGPAGIGKTTLLGIARQRARELGFDVLHASGGELERDLPLDAVRHLFERRLTAAETGERDRWLTGAAARGAAALGFAGEPPDDLAGLMQGLYWLAVSLAEHGPVALVIDDAQWTDPATQRWLAYLARRIEEVPIALVLGVRTGEPGPDASYDAERLPLAPLSEAAIEVLVRERHGDAAAELGSACFAAARGNPYLTHELLAAGSRIEEVRDLVPGTIARYVLDRLARLPEPATAVATAVAVLGEDDAALRYVAALATVDAAIAASTGDALASAGVLAGGRPMRFEHPVVRSAVYGAVTEGVRAQMHARAAAILTAESAPPERIARHLLLTEPAGDSSTVATLRAAAARALQAGDGAWAARLLDRALAEPATADERPAVTFELGQAALATGDLRGLAWLEDALALAPNGEERARVLLALGLASAQHRGMEAGLMHLDEFATAARERSAAEGIGAELLRFGVARTVPHLLEGALERLEEIREWDGAPDDPRLLGTLAGERAYANAPVTEVLALADRALERGLASGAYERGPWLGAVVDALMLAGARDRVEALVDGMLTRVRAEFRVSDSVYLLGTRGWARMEQGDLAGAEADMRAGFELLPEEDVNLAPTAAFLATCLVGRGDLQSARDVLAIAEAAAGLSPTDFAVRYSRGLLLGAESQHAAAIDSLREAGAIIASHGLRTPAMLPWRAALARSLLALGDTSGALEVAREQVELATESGTPVALGIGQVALGMATEPDEAVAFLEEAVGTLEATPARYELAVALYQLGLALRRRRQLTEAREPLARALDLADRCGAAPLAELARGELVSVGARPRRTRLSGIEALTARERQVAELAGSGLTNREIAQALFLSLKTVEKHLGSTYQKLDVKAREHLQAALSA